MSADARDKAREGYRRARKWVRKRLPPGVRSVVGVGLIAGGVLGFLPILGFWMIPLGVGVISLDVGWAARRLRGDRRDEPEDED